MLGVGRAGSRWVALGRFRLVPMPKQANETQVHVVPAKWLEIKIKHAKEKTSVGNKTRRKSNAATEIKVQAAVEAHILFHMF